ncbi:transglutaminase-like domain-containing protein [Chengkuizengella sediminis]|uniref:transglutaminase-like domain-containing protein n=1 Tax=Chengkuizengella sediminis TaxID=1885917 RepID=UPI001389443C|nr:transglutaminase domain-containing protein [Chengkuizengella sediminis]NDI34997.1 transglutaminase domain-containing protein [Chengkuizengella sediminis]
MEHNVKPLNHPKEWIVSGIICVFLFILCWEWIHPLLTISNFKNMFGIYPFIITLGLFILIDYLYIPFVINWFFKICICWFLIIYGFYSNDIFNIQASVQYFQVITSDVSHMWNGKWHLWSSENRVFMFVFGWSIIISIIQSLMVRQLISGWFVTITIMYLFFLQLVFGMDTSMAIIRSLSIGLLSMALLHYVKMKQHNTKNSLVHQNKNSMMIWTISVVIIICMIISVGMILSKDKTKEIEVLNLSVFHDYLKEMASSAKVSGENIMNENLNLSFLSGYGLDDSTLGGQVQLNHDPVFVGETEKETYWRGETKSFYDGKGWLQVENAPQLADGFHVETSIPTEIIQQNVLIQNHNLGNIVFSGGTIHQFDGLVTSDGTFYAEDSLMIDPSTQRYNIQNLNDEVLYYQMKVELPDYESQRIQNTNLKVEQTQLSHEERLRYLQLPKTLPPRVKNLSEEITSELTHPYTKTLAIEKYLKENYEYNLEKTVIPAANEDFVDHFLFEQKLGYCDHFSTSMVVMLRSIGIPARWVKGFAPGELQNTNVQLNGGLKEYIVRNSDAHSWAEAYIEGIGWIPFEPTPDFTSHVDEQVVTALNQSFIEESMKESQPFANQTFNKSLLWGIVGLISIVGFLLVTYLNWRNDLALWYKLRKLDFSENKKDMLVKRYERYWVKLFHYFGEISQGQSVKEYVAALKFPKEEQNMALNEFASKYEILRYSENPNEWISKKKLNELWYKMVNK